MISDLLFIDTWGWLALGHRKDRRHHEVKAFYERLRANGASFYTSDYVLDELITLLFRRENFEDAVRFLEGILNASNQGSVTIERITSARFSAAWLLRRKFKDKQRISFTDLTSMAVMKERAIQHVLTDDDHFEHVGMGFLKCP